MKLVAFVLAAYVLALCGGKLFSSYLKNKAHKFKVEFVVCVLIRPTGLTKYGTTR